MNELDILRSMENKEFVRFIAEEVLPKIGYKYITITDGPGDKGCDVIAFYVKHRKCVCIQIKKYSKDKKVDSKEIIYTINGMKKYRCKRALIITTSDFTPSALQTIYEHRLWHLNGSELIRILRERHVRLPITSELTLKNNEIDNKVLMEEEAEFFLTDIKDAGAFMPISISEAIRIAKNKLSHYKEVKLISVKAHLKRLYIFKGKVSYKLKRRRSRRFIISIDGDGNIYWGILTLVKNLNCGVEYETNSEFYYNARDQTIKIAEKLVPQGAIITKIKLEGHKSAWVVSYYILRFKVGLTKAEVIVDRKGNIKNLTFDPLDEGKVEEFYKGKIVKQNKEIKVIRELNDNFLEEITINEVGEAIKSIKRVKPDYAISLARDFYHINKGEIRFEEVSDGVKVDIFFNNYHHLAKINNEGKIVDKVVVPDINTYDGTEKGYNKKRRCLIVKEGIEIKVINDSGVIERKEIPNGILSKLKFLINNIITSNYSIDTDDPLELL
ncbi:MAG: restriction endonuclease [Candidatus Nanopusillus sp.]